MIGAGLIGLADAVLFGLLLGMACTTSCPSASFNSCCARRDRDRSRIGGITRGGVAHLNWGVAVLSIGQVASAHGGKLGPKWLRT